MRTPERTPEIERIPRAFTIRAAAVSRSVRQPVPYGGPVYACIGFRPSSLRGWPKASSQAAKKNFPVPRSVAAAVVHWWDSGTARVSDLETPKTRDRADWKPSVPKGAWDVYP